MLIIGVGNTAMDCCRSAKRLGATDVKVIARKTRKYFKASPWELEDAEEEGVEILENLQPVRFIIENGTLTGMEFDQFKSVEIDGKLQQEAIGRIMIPLRFGRARDRPGQRVSVDRARHRPRVRQEMGHAGRRQDDVHVDAAGRVLRRRRGVWPGQHHLGGRARASGGDLDPQLLPGRRRSPSGPPHGMTLTSTKMGLHEWAYSNNYDPSQRVKMLHVDMPHRFQNMTIEVEKGFTPRADRRSKSSAASTATSQTHFTDSLCIECDACIDICPTDCLTITPNGDEPRARAAPDGAAHRSRPAAVRLERR